MNIFKLVVSFILLFAASLPLFALAQDFPIPYWGPLLENCPGGATNCNLCHLIKTGWNISRFFLTLLFVIAVPAMVAIGGIMIMVSGANEGLLALGKKILTGAVVGLLIGMSAFLIISTIIWLVGAQTDNIGSGKLAWPEIVCDFKGIEILPP